MIYIVLILSALISYLYYRKTIPEIEKKKKLFLTVLRFIVISIVLALLINPVINFTRKYVKKPEVLLLTDNSNSMMLPYKETTKQDFLSKKINNLNSVFSGKNFKVKSHTFANGLKGNKDLSILSKTLSQLNQNNQLTDVEEIHLLSDGWFHDQDLDVLNKLHIPIITYGAESESNGFDLKIGSVKYNKTAYIDEITPLRVDIIAKDYNKDANVDLFINEKLVDSKKISFNNTNYKSIDFEYNFSSPGLYPFEVKINSEAKNEIQKNNNSQRGAFQVVKNRTKIVLISDAISWDASFLAKSTKSNPRWESVFYQIRDKNCFKGKSLVTLNSILENTETLILINQKQLAFSDEQVELINNFVRNGGGLLYQGLPIDELMDILPVKRYLPRKFEASLVFTEQSQSYVTFRLSEDQKNNIPPVQYFYVDPKVEANILSEIENEEHSAGILYSKYGNGKVLFFSFYDLWKWQLWSEGNEFLDWSANIIAWLSSKNQNRFVAFTNKNHYWKGESIDITLMAFDEKLIPRKEVEAVIEVLDDKGNKVFEEYLLSDDETYKIQVNDLTESKYTYKIVDNITNQTAEGSFYVSNEDIEAKDYGFNSSLLQYISSVTRGKHHSAKDSPEITKASLIHKTINHEIPLYRKWYIVLSFLLAFCLELFFRKRWGLL